MILTCHTCAIALLCLSLPLRDLDFPYFCDGIILPPLFEGESRAISVHQFLPLAVLSALHPSFASRELCGWNSSLLLLCMFASSTCLFRIFPCVYIAAVGLDGASLRRLEVAP